jgi:hypothetical protein
MRRILPFLIAPLITAASFTRAAGDAAPKPNIHAPAEFHPHIEKSRTMVK